MIVIVVILANREKEILRNRFYIITHWYTYNFKISRLRFYLVQAERVVI
jgi:hypothetical protein